MVQIFDYVLKTDFHRDYIGSQNYEKAYSYFDCGFVDEILLHIPDVVIKIIYSKFRASMIVINFEGLRVAIQDNGKMLTYWCTCIDGVSQCLNHVIACLYKIE